MRVIKPKVLNPGDKKVTTAEPIVENVDFNVFKFNNRPRPEKDNVLIVSCFSEFGCETVGVLYCIPEIVRANPGKYIIIVGWYGREYFYRHLVDEFWEIKEEHMWLKEYSRAFHHQSKNLEKIETSLVQYGAVMKSNSLGNMVLSSKCNACNGFWGTTNKTNCPKCHSDNVRHSLFADVKNRKSELCKIPNPSQEKLDYVKKYLGPNPVGIFARGRICYGRNLQPEFYAKLIDNLKLRGYTPIWLGEKASTQPCPVSDVVDFSRNPESRDLELTLAIISQLKFTIQYWTASSRLAAIMGVPFILMESPDQIWGTGQEGYRLNLVTHADRKMILCHFLDVFENNELGLELTDKAIDEVEVGNYEDIFGMTDDLAAKTAKRDHSVRIGSA